MAKRKHTPSPAQLPVVLMFESPESESIISASYDPVAQIATIHFKTGKSYDYNIQLPLWTNFEQSSSKGRFFSERIRPFFPGKLRTLV